MGLARPLVITSSLLTALGACMPNMRTLPAGPGERLLIAHGDVENRSLKVPPGHYPPPGQCRLWYPGRPPGQQPKAGNCVSITRVAPAGSMVLYRPTDDKKVVHARVVDSKRDGVIVVTRIYEVEKGTYLRDEKPNRQ